jgi:hypothetical protein
MDKKLYFREWVVIVAILGFLLSLVAIALLIIP